MAEWPQRDQSEEEENLQGGGAAGDLVTSSQSQSDPVLDRLSHGELVRMTHSEPVQQRKG